MTTEAPELAPEIVAAQEQLGGLPEAWRDPELVAAVLRRARLTVAHRVLAERAAAAQAAVSAALAALIDGDTTAAGELAGAESARAAELRAAELLPPAVLDPAPFEGPLTLAVNGWAQCASDLRLPVLDVETEVDAWRQACAQLRVTFEPVVVTDAERELMAGLAPLRGRLDAWTRFSETWHDLRLRGSTDPLALLGSATTYLRIAAELAPDVADAAASIEAANTARRAAGRTWSADTAVLAR